MVKENPILESLNHTYKAYNTQRKCLNSLGESPVSTIGLSSDRPSAAVFP
jgi:hypothetical protein